MNDDNSIHALKVDQKFYRFLDQSRFNVADSIVTFALLTLVLLILTYSSIEMLVCDMLFIYHIDLYSMFVTSSCIHLEFLLNSLYTDM